MSPNLADVQPEEWPGGPVVVACAELIGRAGAKAFRIGFLDETTTTGWFAQAEYGDTTIRAEAPTPEAASRELATKLLTGATCKCRQPVTLSPEGLGCHWRVVGRSWQSGCTAPPIELPEELAAQRDLGAMRRQAGLES